MYGYVKWTSYDINALCTVMLNNFSYVPDGKINTINNALQKRSLAVFRKLQYIKGNICYTQFVFGTVSNLTASK